MNTSKNSMLKKAAALLIILFFIGSSFLPMVGSQDEVSADGFDNRYPMPLGRGSDDPPTFYEETGRWYNKPASYDELISWYLNLEQNFSDYLYVFNATEMYNTGIIPDANYGLYMIRITNESTGFHKPEVLFQMTIHGNEKTGAYGGYWFTDWLMRHAYHPDYDCPEREWLQWLVDNREIYIVTCMNPDGFDENRRTNDWGLDMNRDYGHSRSSAWDSTNTQTVRRFCNNHTIRTAIDMHTGAYGMPYPWSNKNVRLDMWGLSPISGRNYSSHCPPDFYYFDSCYLRMGDYVGDYGGGMDEGNINPWANGPCLGYDADGSSCDWMYGANVERCPAEDPYVEDEIFGPDPGSGIMSTLVEFGPGNPNMGNDTNDYYGAEVRRCILHQTDFAQPYIRWQGKTIENNSNINLSQTMMFTWQVNGSLVVDSTQMQWSTHPDPINNPQFFTSENTTYAGQWRGGTGWDGAESGSTNGVTYQESISIDSSGDYYFVAKAKVDQIYKDVIHPEEYGTDSYLRVIHERTNESFYEEIDGTDGPEVVEGQLWWYSPVIHVRVGNPNFFQKSIVVNHTKVMGNLTHFPMLVHIDSDDHLATYAQEDGHDIRFIQNSNQLNHEIEYYDNSTGTLIAWVNVSSLSATEDTMLIMQYGNESWPSQENASGVWDASYQGVWHFHDDVSDSTRNNNDGTNFGSNDSIGFIGDCQIFDGDDYIAAADHCLGAENNWTISCWTKSNSSSPMIYHYFLSTGGYTTPDAVNLWHNIDGTGPEGTMRCRINDADGDEIDPYEHIGKNCLDDDWHLVHATWDASSHTLALYVDGIIDNVSSDPTVDTGTGTTNDLHIGARTDFQSERFHIGKIDEVRMSNPIKNASWIATEYNNQYDPQSFYSISSIYLPPQPPIIQNEQPPIGSEDQPLNPLLSASIYDHQGDKMNITFSTNATGTWQAIDTHNNVSNGTYSAQSVTMTDYNTTYYWRVNVTDGQYWTNETNYFTTEMAPPKWWNSTWAHRKQIIIDHTKISEDLTNFPILISLEEDADLALFAQSDGDDIVFTDYTEHGNQLYHEIEIYDQSDGQLVVWVNIPRISSTEDTNLFMYYGNPSCTNQEHPEDVWDDNYMAVWHLSEDPGSAGTGGIKDSTQYYNNGTDHGGMDTDDHVSGMIGYGIDFDGSDDIIEIDDSNVSGHNLDFTNGPFTLEAWFTTPRSSNQGTLIAKRDGDSLDQYQLYVQPELQFRANSEYGLGSDSLSIDTWYFAAVVVDDLNYPEIYRDGNHKTWVDNTGTRPYDFIHRDVPVSIGARYQGYASPGFEFQGIIDEVRISDIQRNNSWLLATYDNIHSPSTFYSVQNQENANGAPTIIDVQPANYEEGVQLIPTLLVEAYDFEGDQMNVTFRTNASGSWSDITSFYYNTSGIFTCESPSMNEHLTTYWWSINISDVTTGNWTNNTYQFTTRSSAPIIYDPSPAPGETNIGANPQLSISVLDYDEANMNLIFRSNHTGSWQNIGVYEEISNGQHYHQTNNMTMKNQTYWWSVNVSDSGGNWTNETFNFTTTDEMLTLKWTVSGLSYMNRGVLLEDINGDNREEIIQIHGDTVICLDGFNGDLVWSHPNTGSAPSYSDRARLEIADLNNDAIPDVILPLARGVLALNGSNGEQLWKLTGLSGSYIFSSPVVFDIEGYGYPYIYVPVQDVVEPLDGTLNKISADGQLLESVWAYRPCAGGCSLADFNFDGNFQVIVGDRSSGVGLAGYDADDLAMNWNVQNLQMNSAIPVIGDATSDGTMEVCVAMQNGNRGFAVVDDDGTVLKVDWSMEIGGHGLSATIHDFDDDGDIEMIFGCGFASDYHDLVVWNLNPDDWYEDARFYTGNLRFSPHLADITGDGELEMIAASNTILHIFNKTYDKIYEYTGLNSELCFPNFNDIDGDGLFELVITSTSGRIYAFDTFSPVPDPAPRSEVQFYSEYRRGVAEYVERPGPKHPMQRDMYPGNGSEFINPNPVLSAHVWDYQWDAFNVTFRTNASGSWEDIITYTDIGRYPNETSTGLAWGTYTATPSGMDQPNTRYHWSIYAEDSMGNSVEHFYHFTTADVAPYVSDPLPVDGAKGVSLDLTELTFNLTDLQGDLMNWSVETMPDIGDGVGVNDTDGQYSIPVGGLMFNTSYTWFVNVSDGSHWTNETFMFTTRPGPGVWWNNQWTFRKEIIVDNTMVVGSHTDFPLLIEIESDGDLVEHAQDDFDDLVFTDYNGNKLDHEIEWFDAGVGSALVWVQIPSLSVDELTMLYLYYGNPSCDNMENPVGTWRSEYRLVQHLNETSGTHYDSTSFDNDGTPVGGLVQDGVGLVDGADVFDGVDDYVDLGGTTDFDEVDLTMSAWVKSTLDTSDMRIMVGGSSYSNKWHLIMDDGYLMVTNDSVANANLRSSQLFNDGSWHYVVGTRDPLQLFVDGQIVSASPKDEQWSLDGGAKIGAKSASQYFFNGSIDEARVYHGQLSAEWIETEYYNQLDPSGFYVVGDEETGAPDVSGPYPADDAVKVVFNPVLSVNVVDPEGASMDVFFRSNASGSWVTLGSNLSVGDGLYRQPGADMDEYLTVYYWSVNCTDGMFWTNETYRFTTKGAGGLWWNTDWVYRKEIIVDHSLVGDTLVDFPLLISVVDGDLAADAQVDGGDVVFTDYEGNVLDHEIEVFNSSTGNLTAWVRVPFLSGVVNTSLYVYYGNGDCENQENPSGVWSADYEGVWHVHDDFGDSTGFGNDAVNYGSIDAVGVIGDGQFFGGDDYVTAASHCLGAGNNWTASCWFRSDSTSSQEFHYLLSTANYNADNAVNIWQSISDSPSGEMRTQILDSAGSEIELLNYGGGLYNDGNWHLVHVTWDNTSHQLSLYVDGSLETQDSNTYVDTGDGSTNALHMGSRTDYDTDRFHIGDMDEIRISNPVKNSSWIWTEYQNQGDPESFFDIGDEENAPTGDVTPPVITDVLADPESQLEDEFVNISCDVTDDVEVNMVKVNITDPTGDYVNITMIGGSYYWNDTYSEIGTYTFFIWANDTSNNSAKSIDYTFDIVAPAEETLVSILPSSQTVSVGESFMVSVFCDPVVPIEGFEFDLDFDPSLIQADSVSEGDIFGDHSTFFDSGSIDNSVGYIDNVFGLITDDGNVTTSGYCANISFTALSTVGVSDLLLLDVGVTNDSAYVPIEVVNGSVSVESTGDSVPPMISDVGVSMSDPLDTSIGWENVSCVVTDNVGVDQVRLNLTFPDGHSENISMVKSGDTYYYNVTLSDEGTYSYYIWTNDTSNNQNTSTSDSFELPPNWDINIDHQCSIVDLIQVSNHFDETGDPGWIREDVTNNGDVSIVDLIQIANRFDETW